MTETRFVADILANRCHRAILESWDLLDLPDGWLVAGSLFQTVWNLQAGRDPESAIKDYDLFYFDASDLTAEGERAVQQRVERVLGDRLGAPVEVKNQARVHLWYEDYFGFRYPRLSSSRDGIDRFLVPATCVGIRPAAARGLEVYAPNGLAMLYDGVLTPNPLTPHDRLFREKAAAYRERWPWLRIEAT